MLIPMKNKIKLHTAFILLVLCVCISCSRDKSPNPPQDDSISFYSTPEVYDLTKQWAGVFSKLNPDININVVNASGSAIIENLENSRNVSFVSGDFDSVVYARTLWKVVVGRDVIVPVIHSENPLTDEIYKQGVSPAGFSRIINNSGKTE
jgi:ABC-type phosphate transport system substrate-binding protein